MLWSGLIRMAIASIFWFLLFSFLSFVFSAGDKTSAFFLVLFFFSLVFHRDCSAIF